MYIERRIAGRFASAAKIGGVLAIVGPRQAGKTTFLKARAAESGASYLPFDDPDVRGLFDEDIKRFENQYLQGDRIAVLDEVQYGIDPGPKLKYLADSGKRLWVTSSSELLLGSGVLSWLVGRVAIMKLYQFSLDEFLEAKGYRETTGRMLLRGIEEHIAYGGYPKIVLESDTSNKEMLLRDLYETMVFKDMARSFRIEDTASLERFAAYLSHYIGNVLQYDSVCRDTGLSFQSVKKYLDAMEKSYLVVLVRPFYTNRLKEITKQPKLYFIDTGLRNAVSGDFRIAEESRGMLFENYVLSELIKAGKSVLYWRTKGRAEVDFVVREGERVIPIEVKVRSTGGNAGRSMRSFIESYSPKVGFQVFMEGERTVATVGGCAVHFVDVRTLLRELGER